jgi:prepilin-type N-terminal cleavage/methylation domain-containing protein
MVKKNKKFGFTLVEMIIVIMIVGISATFISTSYVIAKRKSEISISSDQILSGLKENRSKVKSGYRTVASEEKEGGEVVLTYGEPKCFGIRFTNEKGFLNIEAPYENGNCVKEGVVEKNEILSGSSLLINDIKIGEIKGFTNIDVLFKPPTGEIILLSDNVIYEDRNLSVDVYAYNSDDVTNHRFVQVDTVSGRLGISFTQ